MWRLDISSTFGIWTISICIKEGISNNVHALCIHFYNVDKGVDCYVYPFCTKQSRASNVRVTNSFTPHCLIIFLFETDWNN